MATDKYKSLVHNIIHMCEDAPERLGAIRLNKVLWYSDVVAYQTTGQSITGETYRKRQFGPVPSNILPILNQLQEEGKITIEEPRFFLDPRRFISQRIPESGPLSEDQIRICQGVLNGVLGRTANEISEITHDIIWDAASMGEEIPLYATLVAVPTEITPENVEWAKKAIEGRKVA